jgi:hypothetical protein
MVTRHVSVALLLALALVAPGSASAQGGSDIDRQDGAGTGQLGDIAQIRIPDGYRFAGRDGVRRFLELTQNPVSGEELPDAIGVCVVRRACCRGGARAAV